MPSFLHIGCNTKRQDRTTREFAQAHWHEVRLDIDASVSPDIVGSMTDMKAVETGSMDALFSSHNLEHLYPHEVPVALDEFRRVLRNDGYAVITCPDLQEVCRLISEDKLVAPIYTSPAGAVAPLDVLYGHRPSLARGNHYMAHRCGFTVNVLIGTLRQAGFASVAGYRRGYPYFDLWVVASRLPMGEGGLRDLLVAHQPV